MNGKLSSTADRVKTQADVSATYNGESLKFPIYLDSATKEFDVEIFAGIPDLIKDTFVGKTDFFASSAEFETLLKLALPEDQYKEFEKTIQKSFETGGQPSALSKALTTYIQSYIDKNSEKIQKFESIKGEKVSESGTYSFTLSKTDLQTMVTEFLSNKDNYQLVKDEYATVPSFAQAESTEMPDAETLTKTISEAMDKLKSLDLTVKFTIGDGYITGINIGVSGRGENDAKVDVAFSVLISDINKAVTITMPDKNADSTLDIIDYVKKMLTGQSSGIVVPDAGQN
jgi:hypothetical protein